MSITRREPIPCPACRQPVEVVIADSINASRHDVLRRMVLERRLHLFTCGGCEKPFLVEKELTYFDWGRRQLIAVFPREQRANERACAVEVMAAYHRFLEENAPAFVQKPAEDFLVRICFGYEELREKLVIDEADLSDLVMEAVKADLLATDPRFAASGVITLRLDRVEPETLQFRPEWLGPPPADAPLVMVKAELYNATALRYDELLTLRPGLASGPHVSLLRLLVWPAPVAPSPALQFRQLV